MRRGDGEGPRAGWSEVSSVVGPDGSVPARWTRVAVPLAIAGLFAVAGWRTAAILVALVGVATVVVASVAPPFDAWLERVLTAVGHAAGRLLSIVLLGLLELFVLAPVAFVSLVIGHTPFAGGRWEVRPVVEAAPGRSYGLDPLRTGSGSRALHLISAGTWALGVFVALAVLNYSIGWLWDERWRPTEVPEVVEVTSVSPRTAPAMRGLPWRDGYWREFASLSYDFAPFLLSRVADVDGRFITSTAGVRRSFEPPGPTRVLPVVWFFGGAALWGQGQRDLHTIPSAVSRVASSRGRPVRVVNFGQPGYTTWQSALLLEQELAVWPAPDLVVFYDGADDTAVQIEQPSDHPSHYNARQTGGALEAPDDPGNQFERWWEDYQDNSALHRALEQAGLLFGVQPAAADDVGLAERVAAVRLRSVDLAMFAAAGHGVPVLFALQAAQGVPGDRGAYRGVDAGILAEGAEGRARTIDLRGTLDAVAGQVYLDGVLTNETGARLVARSLWSGIDDALDEAEAAREVSDVVDRSDP